MRHKMPPRRTFCVNFYMIFNVLVTSFATRLGEYKKNFRLKKHHNNRQTLQKIYIGNAVAREFIAL